MNIKLFGLLADLAGSQNIVLKDVSDTDELRINFNEIYPDASSTKYLIAVNQKIVGENYSIKDSDEIALLPPFSGG